MVKSIIKRIIVGVGILLIMQLISGNLIGDVNAQVLSYYTSNGNNLGSCTDCSSYTYDYAMFTNSVGTSGYLSLNTLLYSTTTNTSYIPILSRVRVVSNNVHYNCEVTSTGFSHELYNTGGQFMNATSYSISCPMTIGSGGISSVFFQFSGSAGFSFYSPVTFIVSDSSAITQQIQESTQEQINSQKTCKKYDKNAIAISDKFLGNTGQESSTSDWGISKYIKVYETTTIETLVSQNSASYCFYNVNKELISCTRNNTLVVGQEVTIPTDASYVRFSLKMSTNSPQFKICNNGNQGVVDSNEQLNDTLNDGNISSSTTSSMNDVFTFNDRETTFGPVADLLLLPLTLWGAFYSGFSTSCSTYSLGTLFGHELTLPCINVQNILGGQLYSLIDVAFSLFMIYNILMMCIDIFDRITSFEDPFNELYSPRHTYHGRHEGGGSYHG